MQTELSLGLSRRLEEVSRALRREIAAGAWPPGRQVPPERELAQHYGLARNSLRRVLRRLEDEGLLERHVGRGTFVRLAKGTTAPPAATPPRLEVAVRLKGASPADLMEVRLLVEPQVVALAASRASAADLQAIEQALKQSIAAKGLAEFEHWDAQLHLAIFRAAKNGILSAWCEAINQVRNEPDWYRLKKRSLTPELRLTYDREHSAIVTALKERDPEGARRAMSQHLTRVRDSLLAIG
jgi:DNA-binding FadR family transcriptional regulator